MSMFNITQCNAAKTVNFQCQTIKHYTAYNKYVMSRTIQYNNVTTVMSDKVKLGNLCIQSHNCHKCQQMSQLQCKMGENCNIQCQTKQLKTTALLQK